MPASFGSDDSLQVWFNGQQVVSENASRGAAPDQNKATLKFKPGKNKLLIKVGQGTGDFAFYFKADTPKEAVPPMFEDATAKFAPPIDAKSVISGQLLASDLNGDGNADLLLAGTTAVVALASSQGYKLVADHGLKFASHGSRPAIGDFDGDKLPDVFVPCPAGSRLYRSLGQGHFADVTAKSGDLAGKLSGATSAAWADLDNNGKPGLVVGCLKGPNRYFRHSGGSAFTEATEELGLHQKVFNSRAVCAADVNGDGTTDLLLNNEAQAAVALLGNPERVVTKVAGK